MMNRSKKSQDYGNVAVLMGGRSAEREISLNSGEAIYQSLNRQDLQVFKIDPAEDLYVQLKEQKIDRAFIALHGRDGEDGVIQGFLKTLNIPFTGCDMTSSSIAMNKLLSKRVWQQMGITTAPFMTIVRDEVIDLEKAQDYFKNLGSTLFVKPVNEGSSLGVSKVTNTNQFVEAINNAHVYDEQALIESFVAGEEYFVGILKDKSLPSIKIKTSREYYDYQAKYQSTDTEYFCPSGLDEQQEKIVQDLALKAFRGLGCSGWGRIDFIRERNSGEFFILEANTVPGMTESSLLPKAAKQLGISFDDLVIQILETSFKHEEDNYKGMNHD